MKIRSQDEFFDRLDKESSWRKKELSDLLIGLKESKPIYDKIFTRSGIALAYAHWEGFVKSSSEMYLIYLTSKKLKGSLISSALRDCYLSTKLSLYGDVKKIRGLREFMIFLEKDLSGSEIILDHKKAIITKSNLRSDVFCEIIIKIGLDPNKYDTRFNMIDQMVDHRNAIAHGENVPISKDKAEAYILLARQLIEEFRTDLSNSIVTESYLLK